MVRSFDFILGATVLPLHNWDAFLGRMLLELSMGRDLGALKDIQFISERHHLRYIVGGQKK